MKESDINYTKEAFLHPWNLTFLIVAMVSALLLNGLLPVGDEVMFNLILVLSAALELVFLGTMPRNERFRRAVRSRQAAEHAKPPSQKEIFNLLTKYSQRRYIRLRKLEKDIQVNYAKLSYASQGMLNSHLQKIDGLLDSYLNLLYQKERYENSLHSTVESEVVNAIASLRTDMENDPPRVQAIKQRRLKVLEGRLSRFKKARENLEIIEAQLETIEDVTKYIQEQSLTLRNPEEITFQLDHLLSEVEETQASVEQIEEVFSRSGDLLSDIDSFEQEDTRTQNPNRSGLQSS